MIYKIKQFFKSVWNLIIWFPVIWNDRQWDDDFFFEILRKKLILMEEFFRSKKANHLYAVTEDVPNIRIAIETLDRILDHNYLEIELQDYHTKYQEENLESFFEECEDHPGFMEYVDKRSPEQQEMFAEGCKRAEEKENQDFNDLFDHLKAHVREWWD